MTKPPAFQMYAKDFLGDAKVQSMSADAQAYYALLLIKIWSYDTQYSIPDDNDLIAGMLRITVERWVTLREEILRVLTLKNNRLVSHRLHRELAKQRKYRKQQSLKGKKSAQLRYSRGSTTVQPVCNPREEVKDLSLSKEAYRFIEIISSYNHVWVIKEARDSKWFDKEILFGAAGKGLDVADELEGWASWLEQEWRKREAHKTNKFPASDFKRSFRWRLKKAREFGHTASRPKREPPYYFQKGSEHGEALFLLIRSDGGQETGNKFSHEKWDKAGVPHAKELDRV